MNRKAICGSLLVGLGLGAGVSLGRWGERGRVEPTEERLEASPSPSRQSLGASEVEGGGTRHAARLEQRIELLAAKLAAEADERRRLEERLSALATEIAAQHASGRETEHVVASTPESVAAAPATAAGPGGAAAPAGAEEGIKSMEGALVVAGIDAATAAEIKGRRDRLALSEIYLRDLAAREGRLDTPQFADEMAEIERQRTSIRDEIGDTAYDRYLAALDQPNRVAVDEVLLDSPAAVAGLQVGDVVLRYGETRIFSPDDLVAVTHGGTVGETVRVAIIRQGQRLEIQVPRGPLGVRIAGSRGDPGEG
jgi:membrane-associated protease RseP (regulator of RpoE activity)